MKWGCHESLSNKMTLVIVYTRVLLAELFISHNVAGYQFKED